MENCALIFSLIKCIHVPVTYEVSAAILNAYIMSIFANYTPLRLSLAYGSNDLCDLGYPGSDLYDKINHPLAL